MNLEYVSMIDISDYQGYWTKRALAVGADGQEKAERRADSRNRVIFPEAVYLQFKCSPWAGLVEADGN